MRLASPSPARKYTWGVLLFGVVGAALVPVFVLGAHELIKSQADDETREQAVRAGRFLQRELERGLRRLEDKDGRVRDPREAATWRGALLEVEETLKDYPSLLGLRLRGSGWELLSGPGGVIPATAVAGDPSGLPVVAAISDSVLVVFPCPFRNAPDARVDVAASLRPAATGGERRLRTLVTYGAGGLGVVLYLLAALGILVNRAQARLVNQEREKATRLKAMGEVAGGIAHEVRNPLNAISLSVQYMEKLMEKGGRTPAASDYARIHLELGKIRKVVDNFVRFARIRDLVVGPIDLGRILDQVLLSLAPEIESAGVRLEVAREGDLSSTGDEGKIAEVLDAVIRNALDALRGRPGGDVRIRLAGARRSVRITVRDTGEVLDEAMLRNIFVPYFTTRENALGLGMTMARTLVESHGGTIEAAGAQGGGCVVSITLPR